ncbi:MAG: hypothetical protein K9J30_12220 [Bacteroidales bacterium]|nr:hypothetical protein [Bacteroidales bacterium]
MIKKIYLSILLGLIVSLFTGCESDQYHIPYVRVDLHLNIISELGNPALSSTTLIDGGVNGLIVYREDYDLFHVYDRTCTRYPDHNEMVLPDEEFEGVFTCPECKSRYMLLLGGDPIEGPATFGLHEYYSVVEGDLLHVYN